ncbi:MAG: hypothetical protein PHC86_08930 [Eubacteriales bacterium]|nr:hypothetical protein [Eubacteriales bacterium]
MLRKRVLSRSFGAFAIILLCVFYPMFNLVIVHATDVPSGDGSSSNPFLITHLADLVWLKDRIADPTKDGGNSEYYHQTSDIDLATLSDWTPIGEGSASGFRGTYDGQSYTVSHLQMTVKTLKKTGLFSINRGTIKNLGVTEVAITGGTTSDEGVGALVGVNKGSIARCWSTGSISTAAKATGGLIGQQTTYDNTATPSLIDAFSTVSVIAPGTDIANYFGGLIGEIAAGTVQTAYSIGTVDSNAPNISNSKFSGGITGEIKAGASVQNVFTLSIVDNNYDKLYHSGIAGQVGGTLTYAQTSSAIAVKNILTGGVTSNLLTSVGASTFKSQTYFSGSDTTPTLTWSAATAWDFDTVWTISALVNDGLPTLQPQRVPVIEAAETTTTAAPTTATTTAVNTSEATTTAVESTTEATTTIAPTTAATTEATETVIHIAAATTETVEYRPVTRSGEALVNDPQEVPISESNMPNTGESRTTSIITYLICAAIIIGAYGIFQSQRNA